MIPSNSSLQIPIHHPRAHRALLVLCLLPTVLRAAQDPVPYEIRATRFDQPPTVDGDVLDDEAWRGVQAAGSFRQSQPFEGEPATERTEVRIGFDDSMLYIGVICFDSQPSTVIVSDSRRDPGLENEDSVRILLDTYFDRQNALVFGTNLAGAQYDGQVTGAGTGSNRGGSSRSRSGGANLDWDTSWTVRTKLGGYGWSAEFAIPFRSLRYAAKGQRWGLNVERNIRRNSERDFWAPLGREFSLFRVSAAGTLVGMEPPKQRSLQVVPYVLGSTADDGVEPRSEDADAGVDLKYSLTPSLTLDLTANTDFAQVEVDDQQVNLDRFSLFFPEKRPFFLENAGLFKVGSSSSFPGSAGVELFFSRRIGLEDGQQVPIVGGARLSGKVGKTNVGFLNMQTDEQADLQANNFTVARASREWGNRARAGFIAVQRLGTGSLAPDDDTNRTWGVDGAFGIGEYGDVTAWAAKTETEDLDGRDHALGVEGQFSSPNWRWRAGYSEVGEDFNPEVGFVNRDDYRRLNAFVLRRIKPKKTKRIQEIGPRIFYDSYWGFDGLHQSERYSVGGELQFRSGARLSLSAGGNLEELTSPFEISEGIVIPAERFVNNGFFLFGNTNRGRAVSFSARVQGAGFFSGDQLSISPQVNWRVGSFLSSELSWSYNDIELREGEFETNLGRLRLTFAFSTRVLLQALIQYNDVVDQVSTNLRFSWLGRANTGLFVVYNEVEEFGIGAFQEPNRSVVVKYSHLIDVFR